MVVGGKFVNFLMNFATPSNSAAQAAAELSTHNGIFRDGRRRSGRRYTFLRPCEIASFKVGRGIHSIGIIFTKSPFRCDGCGIGCREVCVFPGSLDSDCCLLFCRSACNMQRGR